MPSTDRSETYKRVALVAARKTADVLSRADAGEAVRVTITGGPGTDPDSLGKATDTSYSSEDVGVGAWAVDASNNYAPLSLDGSGNLKVTSSGGEVRISGPLTAFGELLVGELTPLVHLTFPICDNTDIIVKNTTAGAAITNGDSMIQLSTGTDASQTASYQSRRVVKYRTGLGILVRFTAIFTTGVVGTYQWIGMGDGVGTGNDGLFFGYYGESFGIVHVQNGTPHHHPQTSWNVDKMVDGSGPSGITLDKTKLNVFQITSQWLGAGNIRFYVENPNTGLFQLVNVISYPNQHTTPSLFNPILPLSAWVSNGATNNNIVLKTASMMGSVEGKNVITGPSNSHTAAITTSATTETGFLALRNRATYLTLPNRVRVYLTAFSGLNDTNKAVTFSVYQGRADSGGTQPGGTWGNVSTDTSVMEYINGPTGTLPPSGAAKKMCIVIPKDNGVNQELSAFDIFLGPEEWIWVTVVTPTTGEVSGTFVWKEDF
jgi:hypothetical protein